MDSAIQQAMQEGIFPPTAALLTRQRSARDTPRGKTFAEGEEGFNKRCDQALALSPSARALRIGFFQMPHCHSDWSRLKASATCQRARYHAKIVWAEGACQELKLPAGVHAILTVSLSDLDNCISLI